MELGLGDTVSPRIIPKLRTNSPELMMPVRLLRRFLCMRFRRMPFRNLTSHGWSMKPAPEEKAQREIGRRN